MEASGWAKLTLGEIDEICSQLANNMEEEVVARYKVEKRSQRQVQGTR